MALRKQVFSFLSSLLTGFQNPALGVMEFNFRHCTVSGVTSNYNAAYLCDPKRPLYNGYTPKLANTQVHPGFVLKRPVLYQIKRKFYFMGDGGQSKGRIGKEIILNQSEQLLISLRYHVYKIVLPFG